MITCIRISFNVVLTLQGEIIRKQEIYLRNSKIFSRTPGSISSKLVTKTFWVKEIQVCSNKELCPFSKADNKEIAKIRWGQFINLLQNHHVNFNQTWHNASFGNRDSRGFFSKLRAICILKKEIVIFFS